MHILTTFACALWMALVSKFNQFSSNRMTNQYLGRFMNLLLNQTYGLRLVAGMYIFKEIKHQTWVIYWYTIISIQYLQQSQVAQKITSLKSWSTTHKYFWSILPTQLLHTIRINRIHLVNIIRPPNGSPGYYLPNGNRIGFPALSNRTPAVLWCQSNIDNITHSAFDQKIDMQGVFFFKQMIMYNILCDCFFFNHLESDYDCYMF